jgi:uncharacterized protein
LLADAELIVHVGDFVGASVFAELRELGRVQAVHGNMDAPDLRAVLPERSIVEAGGVRLGLVHDPGPRTGRYERLRTWFPDCETIVYGHTHWPEAALHDGVWIVNPGSPTERRRAPSHTMAVLRDRTPTLIELSR